MSDLLKQIGEMFDEKIDTMKEDIVDSVLKKINNEDRAQERSVGIEMEPIKEDGGISNINDTNDKIDPAYTNLKHIEQIKNENEKLFNDIMEQSKDIKEFDPMPKDALGKFISYSTNGSGLSRGYVVCKRSKGSHGYNTVPIVMKGKKGEEITYTYQTAFEAKVQAAFLGIKYPNLKGVVGYKLMGL